MLRCTNGSYLKYEVIESSRRLSATEIHLAEQEQDAMTSLSELLLKLDSVVPVDRFCVLTLPSERTALLECAVKHGYVVQVEELPLFAHSAASILIKQASAVSQQEKQRVGDVISSGSPLSVDDLMSKFDFCGFEVVNQDNTDTCHLQRLLDVLLEKLGNPPRWHAPEEISLDYIQRSIASGGSFVYATDGSDVFGCAGLVPLKGSVYDVKVCGKSTVVENSFEVSHVVVLGKNNGKYAGIAPLMQHILVQAQRSILAPRLIVLDATFDRRKETGGGAWKLSLLGDWRFAGIAWRFTGIMVAADAPSYTDNNHLCVYYMARTRRQHYGFHRVLEGGPVTPQAAARVSSAVPCYPTELVLRVEMLNIDSTSTRNIQERGGDFCAHVMSIVGARGKMHNPETQSGGVLVGVISKIGCLRDNPQRFAVGDLVIPLCSMSAIPLQLTRLGGVEGCQVEVLQGHAVLFESVKMARVPPDLPLSTVLHAVDVSRLIPQLAPIFSRYAPVLSILLVGCGASALVAMVRLLELDSAVRLSVCDISESNLSLGARVVRGDPRVSFHQCNATNAQELLDLGDFDVVLSLVNVPGVEAGCSLVANKAIYYFSMATSFASACLSTDLTGKPLDCIIGAGVFDEQAKVTIDLLRRYPELLKAFSKEPNVNN